MNVRSKMLAAVVVMVCAGYSPVAYSYDMDEVVILEQSEIGKLSDTQLVDTYIEVIVDLEAGKTFHTTSGFKPKEYTAYKNLLRYRIRLLMEMQKRGLEAPSLNP